MSQSENTSSSRRPLRVTMLIDPIRGCLYALDLFEKDLYQKQLAEVRQTEDVPIASAGQPSKARQPSR